MQVAVYPTPLSGTPYLCVMFPALDDIETAAANTLTPDDIPYLIIDSDDLPQGGPWTFPALTVDVSGPTPVFDYDIGLARELAIGANNSYWQAQYQSGLLELEATEMDMVLALSTPEASRTPEQDLLVSFINEIQYQRTTVNTQLGTATTGEQLNTILNSTFG